LSGGRSENGCGPLGRDSGYEIRLMRTLKSV
jgi:hypothetical protein